MAPEDDDFIGDEEEEGGQEDEPKGFSEKWVNVLKYSVLFLVVILISVTSSLIVNHFFGPTDTVSIPGLKDQARKLPVPDVYQVPEFKLPLDKQDDESRTTIVQAKIGIAYEKDNQQIVNEIIARKAQIQDKIQYVIASKKYEEINTARGREELKKDIVYAINSIMTEGEVQNVFFSTFVISAISG